MKLEIVSRQTAEKRGYNVDTHVYPWLAYRGPRFAPTAVMSIPTDIEYAAARLVRSIYIHPLSSGVNVHGVALRGRPALNQLRKHFQNESNNNSGRNVATATRGTIRRKAT